MANGVTDIAAGQSGSVVIQNGAAYASGIVWALGRGQSSPFSNTFLQVPGLGEGVTAVAAGNEQFLAIKNGALYTWGYNNDAELGDGSTNIAWTVEAIPSLSSGVTSIAGGSDFSLAVQNGHVFGWGNNTYGQLGNNSGLTGYTPMEIDPTDLCNIIKVVGIADTAYALSSDGSIWAWGEGINGELGNGSFSTTSTPQHDLPPAGYKYTDVEGNGQGAQVLAMTEAVPEPANSVALAAAIVILIQAAFRKRHCIFFSPRRI